MDAAVAGAFAAFVAEPLLASAGGAGMLTAALPGSAPICVDFFPAAPRLPSGPLDFFEVIIDFGATTQAFHVGRGSVAPPLALPGLIEASHHGALPLSELVSPAVRMAREGAVLGKEGAHVFELLWPIQTLSPETLALAGGGRPQAGDALTNPALADLLEELGALGQTPPRFFDAVLRGFGPDQGGLLTEEDLRATPTTGAPRQLRLGDWTVLTSPRIGGKLVEVILGALDGSPPEADEVAEVVRLAEACRSGHDARSAFDARGSTTHISVLDGEGGAASVTLTNGEGCGYVAEGTGVQMNNFLGEEDLNPAGFHRHARGVPLPTMVAPTVGLHHGRPAMAVGSGGSNRIRSVVSQVLHRVMRGEPVEHAVRAPRVHAESDHVWVELADRVDPEAIVEALRGRFTTVHPFAGRAFYFGGVHATLIDAEGRTHAAADARRGGAINFVA